jgi:hypothetical protein
LRQPHITQQSRPLGVDRHGEPSGTTIRASYQRPILKVPSPKLNIVQCNEHVGSGDLVEVTRPRKEVRLVSYQNIVGGR